MGAFNFRNETKVVSKMIQTRIRAGIFFTLLFFSMPSWVAHEGPVIPKSNCGPGATGKRVRVSGLRGMRFRCICEGTKNTGKAFNKSSDNEDGKLCGSADEDVQTEDGSIFPENNCGPGATPRVGKIEGREGRWLRCFCNEGTKNAGTSFIRESDNEDGKFCSSNNPDASDSWCGENATFRILDYREYCECAYPVTHEGEPEIFSLIPIDEFNSCPAEMPK